MKIHYLDLKFGAISVLLSKTALANVKTSSVALKYSFFLLKSSRQKKICHSDIRKKSTICTGLCYSGLFPSSCEAEVSV